MYMEKFCIKWGYFSSWQVDPVSCDFFSASFCMNCNCRFAPLSYIYSWAFHKGAHRGSAVAQAVSCWLPTVAAQVHVRAACGVCGGQSGIGTGFHRVQQFPLPIIPPISPSSWSPVAGTIGLLVAAVPSGPNWTPSPTIPIKEKSAHKPHPMLLPCLGDESTFQN
jgi:hypothetical protein